MSRCSLLLLSGPCMWLWLVSSDVCDERRHLNTDGYTFKFTVDVQVFADDAETNTILGTSTGAVSLYRDSTSKKPVLAVYTADRVQIGSSIPTTLLTGTDMYTLTVEKTVSQVCLQVNQEPSVCNNNVIANPLMGDVGELSLGPAVKNYQQAPSAHAEMYLTSDSKLFRYFLVGIQDDSTTEETGPGRDDYADASDPTLGNYVKPKYGTFTRLHYDCGYQLGGVLGDVELNGTWTWDPVQDSGLLKAQTDPITLVSTSIVNREPPNLPGFAGTPSFPTGHWGNLKLHWYATMGASGFARIDGKAYTVYFISCDPTADTGGSSWSRWAVSPSGASDTNKYVRVWLGQEVVGTYTTTTTGTCTTTTTTTASTSTVSSITSSTTSSISTSSTSTTSSSSTSSSSSSSTTTSSTTSSSTTSTTSSSTSTSSSSSSTTTSSTTSSSTTSTTSSSTSTSSSSSSTTTSSSTSTTSSSTSTSSSSSSTTTSSTTSTTSSSTSTSSSSSSTSTSSTTSSSTTSSTSSTSTSSTSSSTSSSTTSSTSTTSVTDTSTTTSTSSSTTTMTVDLEDIIRWLAYHEALLVDEMVTNPNLTSVSKQLTPGTAMTASRTRSGVDAEVGLEGTGETDVAVTVPAAILEEVGQGGEVVVVTLLERKLAELLDSGNTPVLGSVNLNLFDPTGNKIPVNNTQADIFVRLPVNHTENFTCGYWDEQDKVWTSRGLRVVDLPEGELDGPLVCAATHLTLFGSILKGFIKALTCAQLSLFSRSAVLELGKGDWWWQPMALAFWCFQLFLVCLLCAACCLDRYRARTGGWDDEFFLIPGGLEERETEGKEPEQEVEQEEPEPEFAPSKSVVHRTREACCAVLGCVLLPFSWCYESSACRDALDDLCSRWFKYFGEVRSFIESICENLNLSDGCGQCSICATLTGTMLRSSVKRQVCASLGLSEEMVTCFTEEEELGELLYKAALVSAELERSGRPVGEATKWQRRQVAWNRLHMAITEQFEKHWYTTHWMTFHLSFLRLCFVGNPLTTLFLGCYFTTCAQRVLFFIVEMSGAFMMMTLFYQVSGSVGGKDIDPDCEEELNIGEEIGRIIAIALASTLLGSLPVALLESLHSRSFKRFAYEGCPEWERQLRAWRFQDAILWVVGLGCAAFFNLFVALFLANVSRNEMPVWGAAGGLSLLEDVIIVPVAISFLVPLLATIALTVASASAGVRGKELLKQKHEELVSSGNWNCHQPFSVSI